MRFLLNSRLSPPLALQMGRVFRMKTSGRTVAMTLQFVFARSPAPWEKPPGRRVL